jgi:hypothetical protein
MEAVKGYSPKQMYAFSDLIQSRTKQILRLESTMIRITQHGDDTAYKKYLTSLE